MNERISGFIRKEVDRELSCRVLLVEDDADATRLVTRWLAWTRRAAFDVTRVESADGALALLEERRFDVILLDLAVADARGLSTLVSVCAIARHVPIVVLTATDDDALALQAIRAGAQDYLVKPEQGARSLVRALLHAIERGRRSGWGNAGELGWTPVVENRGSLSLRRT